MNIVKLGYENFTLNFKDPFVNASQVLKQRKGFLISLTDDNGTTCYGESSPLPGFSIETYDEAERNLFELRSKICRYNFSENLEEVSHQLLELGMLPSVRFAIEQAIVNIYSKRDITSFSKYFSFTEKAININAVIGLGDLNGILYKIKRKVENGYSVFKIKIGRDNPYEDFELIQAVRSNFGYGIKLRLDANQKWSSDEAIEYIDRFNEFDIEFIEEPCEYACSIARTIEFSQIPIALDESISTLENAKSAIQEIKAEYFVIKPMVLGSIFSTVDLIKEAEKFDRKIIISSSFESAVAKSALVLLAAYTKHDYAHGLDTSTFFAEDICYDNYKVENGKILFDTNKFPPTFVFNNK